MATVILIAETSVFHHGQILPSGTEFACAMDYAKKLVAGGSARLKIAEKNNGDSQDNNLGTDSQKDNQNSGENSQNDSQNGGKSNNDNLDFNKELEAKLDELTVPKLKELAKKHEITLDSDDKKPEIIKKIVAAGVKLDETNI